MRMMPDWFFSGLLWNIQGSGQIYVFQSVDSAGLYNPIIMQTQFQLLLPQQPWGIIGTFYLQGSFGEDS